MNTFKKAMKDYSLQMPMSTGTVCTPYDSRMIEKREELQARIIARTKRKLKQRTSVRQVKQARQELNWIAGSTALMGLLIVSPFFLIA